jgi:hypothetical protein
LWQRDYYTRRLRSFRVLFENRTGRGGKQQQQEPMKTQAKKVAGFDAVCAFEHGKTTGGRDYIRMTLTYADHPYLFSECVKEVAKQVENAVKQNIAEEVAASLGIDPEQLTVITASAAERDEASRNN